MNGTDLERRDSKGRKVYGYQLTIRDAITGRRRTIKRWGFSTARARDNAKRDAIRDHENGLDAPRRSQLTTVHAWLREWCDDLDGAARGGGLKASTASHHRRIVESYLLRALPDRRLDKLTADDVVTAYKRLRAAGGKGGRALSESTVRHCHVTLRRAMADAAERGKVPFNVVDRVPRLVRPSGGQRAEKPRALTADDARRYVAAALGDRDAGPLVVAIRTGLRRAELCGLEWSDVEAVMRPDGSEAGRLTVRRARVAVGSGWNTVVEGAPKTASSRRTVELDPGTWSVFARERARQAEDQLAIGVGWVGPRAGSPSGYVFRDRFGEPIKPASLRWVAKRVAAAAGVPDVGVHGLRHTMATLGLASGTPLAVISKRCGHSSIATTADLYVERVEAMDAAAADALAATLDGPPSTATGTES